MAGSQKSADGPKIYIGERAIVVDAKTGRLRKPTPEEVAAILDFLEPLTRTGPEGLEFKTLSDGTRQVLLDGRFDNVVLARPAADGTMETRCVSSLEEAARFLGLKLVAADSPEAQTFLKRRGN
jgi:hypothetical protein